MMSYCVGIDLGGTRLKAAVVNMQDGEVSGLCEMPTNASEGHEAVMSRMNDLARKVIETSNVACSDILGIGIGVPGIVDLDRGLTLFLPNLPGNWRQVPLSQRITSGTGLPVFLLNDARSLTLGEWVFGAGRGVDTMACFTLGTGIGGGLVINGQLHLGIGGTAGELGHQTIDPNGLICGCGNRGCLETIASGPAIAAMGVRAVIQGLTTRIGEIAHYDLNRITPETVFQAASQGDKTAQDIYERAGIAIGIAVSNVLVSLGPRKVVLGGGVAQAGDLIFDPVRKTVRERVHMMPVDQVEILPAALGTNAGIIGAAVWANQHIAKSPS
jgi:glucokinase